MCIRDRPTTTGPCRTGQYFVFYENLFKDLRLENVVVFTICLLYTSDAADDLLCVDLGGRRIIKKKNKKYTRSYTYLHNIA